MKFTDQLRRRLADHHLLRHPFYRAWTDGLLTREQLRAYAKQYFRHVDAFPRYVSATHSRCADLRSRQVLLENLSDEERGDENHPELWLRFAEGLGCRREEVLDEPPISEAEELVDTFFAQAYASYAGGLGALFAYEYQVPEIATLKLDSLRRHYGIDDETTLAFFEVHRTADVQHADAAAALLESLSPEERELASRGASRAAAALWHFLDGVERLPS